MFLLRSLWKPWKQFQLRYTSGIPGIINSVSCFTYSGKYHWRASDLISITCMKVSRQQLKTEFFTSQLVICPFPIILAVSVYIWQVICTNINDLLIILLFWLQYIIICATIILYVAILFRSVGFIAPKHFELIWFSNISILSVPDEGYSRNVRTKLDIYVFIKVKFCFIFQFLSCVLLIFGCEVFATIKSFLVYDKVRLYYLHVQSNLYIQVQIICTLHYIGKMRLPFIDCFVIHVPFKVCLTECTVKHAHVVTSIKQSHLSCPVIESFLWI